VSAKAGGQTRVLSGREEVARAAAEIVLAASGRAVDERGTFSIALSGGSTPAGLYRLLGSDPYRSAIAWEKVHLFWADERCVPPDHEDSNYRLAHEALLSKVVVPPGHVHRIRGEDGPDAAAVAYELELRGFSGGAVPVFDLVILGVGEDGHTASLFPGDAMVRHPERLAVPVYRTSGHSRVSLTLAVLNRARQVVFLATGAKKSRIVAAVRSDDSAGEYPAGLVRPDAGGLLWLLDREAAAGLEHST
jgi:6-phosphogluconolactonase